MFVRDRGLPSKSEFLALPLRCYLSSHFLLSLARYYHRPTNHNTLVLTAEMLSKLRFHTVFSTLLSSAARP
jgi:hypothetical protein